MTTPQDIQQQLIQAVQAIPTDNPYSAAEDILFNQCHQQHGRIITTGVGKAGTIAYLLATKFASTGTSAQFLSPLEAVHGDLGMMGLADVLIAFSNSGKTREIVELIPIAQDLHPYLKVICITGKAASPLAAASHVTLLTGDTPEVCPFGLMPSSSTLAMDTIGNILAVQLMERIGFTQTDYAKRHHGGYLGEKARQTAA